MLSAGRSEDIHSRPKICYSSGYPMHKYVFTLLATLLRHFHFEFPPLWSQFHPFPARRAVAYIRIAIRDQPGHFQYSDHNTLPLLSKWTAHAWCVEGEYRWAVFLPADVMSKKNYREICLMVLWLCPLKIEQLTINF